MSPVEARTCATTGLHLIKVDATVGFHVAKSKYSQPSSPERTPDVHRQEWGRFDTIGRTFYIAETVECAFAEVLSALKRPNGSQDPLAPIAEALGLSLEETVAYIAEEWDEDDLKGAGALPRTWYESRRIFDARVTNGGWLVDIHHPDSIAAIQGPPEGSVARFLLHQGVPALNVSVLTSENRYLTTVLASMLRDTTLDDGSSPRGIHFGSKHGAAWCRAIWLPADVAADPGVEVARVTDITRNNSDMNVVARRLGLVG